MQTNEPQEFRFNSRVAIIWAITMLAMIPPLIGVAIAVREYLHPKPAAAAPAVPAPDQPAMRAMLEHIADKTLAPDLSAPPQLEIASANPGQEAARVEEMIKEGGGVSFRSGEVTGQEIRLRAQTAGDQAQKLAKSPGAKWTQPLLETTDGSRVMFEIVIKKQP